MLNKLKNRLKEIRDYRVIKRSGLFDREYYLRNNLDVARSCMNPIMHYIRHGWHEGRNPSAKFNSSSYLKKNYKDVMGAGINPLVHYIRYEKKEGREPCNIIFEPSQKDTFHAKNLTLENGKKFTIIMPTWNRREVICRAIDSILAQSYQNFELIISDDGSTDGTMSMVKEKYAHELNSGRIRYLYHKHTGVSSARNAAARIAKGEWIAYLDTDDTWREHFLLMMASAFIENPAYKTAYSQFTIHDRVQGIDYTVKTPFNSSLIRRQNFISMIVYAHHREVYEECGVFDENLTRYTDWDMIIRHTAVFKPLYIPYVLADYERIKTLNNITFSESHEENQKLLDEKNRNALQRIAIKIPVPDREQAHKWGDYHLTYALQRGLRKAGFTVRTDVLSEWYYPETDQDDIVIVIRGLSSYEPKPHQRNIMWNISHPNKIPLEEYNKYDLVLVASNTYAKFLQANCDVPVYVMLQFTDPEMFFYEPSDELTTDLLFVGNSRKQYRKAVRACVERGIDVDVYGTLWEGIIPEHYIKGQFIRYKELHRYYCSAKIILNDHWDSMRQYGFISNRIYDVAASGGFILSDDCQGIADAFDGCIAIYTDAGDLIHKIEYYLKNPEKRAEMACRLQKIVLRDHTLDKRINQLLKFLSDDMIPVVSSSSPNLVDTKITKQRKDIKIYQTIVSKYQAGHVLPPFIEYDIRKSNHRPEWHEYWQFLNLYNRNKNHVNTYWGNVSFKFTEKTGLSPMMFQKFITDNPGYDVYFVNPFEYLTFAFSSPWEQGELWHPGLIDITQTILDRLDYKINLRKIKIPHSMVAYCNYFVGNGKFWDKYIEFTKPIFDYIENCPDKKLKEKINKKAYRTRPCSYHAFIMERMFSTFLAVKGNHISSLKYNYKTEDILKEACISYRCLAQGYSRYVIHPCHGESRISRTTQNIANNPFLRKVRLRVSSACGIQITKKRTISSLYRRIIKLFLTFTPAAKCFKAKTDINKQKVGQNGKPSGEK